MKLLPRVLLACLLLFLLYDSRKGVTFHFEDITSIEILTNPNGRIVEISEPKQVRKILDSFLLYDYTPGDSSKLPKWEYYLVIRQEGKMPQHIAILNEQNIYYEGQQYHIKKGNINRSHVNAMIIDAEDAMEQPAGVSLSIKEGTLTPGSATVVLTNTSDIDYLFGEGYTLEQEINGVWSYLPISDFLTFNSIAYILNAMESSEKEENWLYPYGQLSPGSYRIAKSIFPRGTQTPQTMYLFAAFTINDSK